MRICPAARLNLPFFILDVPNPQHHLYKLSYHKWLYITNGNSGLWRKKTHFNYNFLRNAFQTALLNEMEAKIGSTFKKVKSACYKNHENGLSIPNRRVISGIQKHDNDFLIPEKRSKFLSLKNAPKVMLGCIVSIYGTQARSEILKR